MSDGESPLLIERHDGVEVWTMNLPDSRNPVSDPDMIDAFEAACRAAGRDTGVRAVIITGAGKAFSAGGNLKHMRERSGMFGGTPAQIRAGYRDGIQRIPRALWDLEVPTIAAVNGPAVGAGCDLTLMCDLRIASERASFAESFVKLGIIPGDGGAWLLPRAVGLSRACEMAFTGDAVDAETALAWGLVSKVVAHDELLDTAHDLAGRIARNPPVAVRMTKRLLREGQHTRLEPLLEMSAAMQSIAHHTSDHAEAVEAFFDKQPRDYKGE